MTSGFSPGSFPVIDTVRIIPPKTSHGGVSISRNVLRPRKPAAAHKTLIDEKRIRPVNDDRRFRLRVGGKRISERGHAGIEDAPRFQQRLVGFEDDRKFGEIETPDIYERTRALLGRN